MIFEGVEISIDDVKHGRVDIDCSFCVGTGEGMYGGSCSACGGIGHKTHWLDSDEIEELEEEDASLYE